MIATARPLVIDLPRTATYKLRAIAWTPTADRSVEDCLGRLKIDLKRSLKPGTKVESDTYAVDEVQGSATPDFRTFQFLNLTDPDQADVYETALSLRRGIRSKCSCMGSSCGFARQISCKHIDALEALNERGALPLTPVSTEKSGSKEVEPVAETAVEEPRPYESCGACNGFGSLHGPSHDRFGYALEPRLITCSYCGGLGWCEEGDKLVPERNALRDFSRN